MRTYGFSAPKLSDAYTLEQLSELRQSIERDPKNANPDRARGSIYLYSKSANRKLDAIAWAITYKLKEHRQGLASGPQQDKNDG